jgi:hypothetical protein
MPSVRKLERYPVEYWRLFKTARNCTVHIACDTPRAARIFRQHLYNFRTALRDADDGADGERLASIRHIADQLSFSISGRILLIHTPMNFPFGVEDDNPKPDTRP